MVSKGKQKSYLEQADCQEGGDFRKLRILPYPGLFLGLAQHLSFLPLWAVDVGISLIIA